MQFGVWECVQHWGRFRPNQVALQTLDRSLSYAALNSEVNRVSNALRAAKLHGLRIGVALRSRVDLIVGIIAILREGKSVVLVNPGLDDSGLRQTLDDAEVAQVLVDQSNERVVDLAPSGPTTRVVRFPDATAGFLDVGPGPTRIPEDEWGVVYSSGTTGTPKGIERDQNSMITELLGWCLELGLTRETTFYVGRPVYYTGGLVLTLGTLLVSGAVWLSDYQNGNDDREVWRDYQAALTRGPVSHAFFVPDQIRAFCRIAAGGPKPLPHAKTILTMGAPISGKEKTTARLALGSQIVESWGNSEGLGTITDPEDVDLRPASIGRPFLSDEMCVVGDDAKPVAVREIGRIAGGEQAGFSKYSSNPEATQKVRREELIISEDVGYVDEDGYFYLRGRVNETVTRSGTTVFTAEVEAKLRAVLGTEECFACGAGDEAEPRLYCLTTDLGVFKSVDEALKRANEQLARAERLDAILVVPSIPRLPAGKIDRVRARQLVLERLTDIEMV